MDMSPKTMKGEGGGGLMSRTRDWDTGTPHGFKGNVAPAKGKATNQKDAANVKQPSGKGPGSTVSSDGPKQFPPPQNVQSAKAPRHPNPATHKQPPNRGGGAIQMGKTKGPDKSPKR